MRPPQPDGRGPVRLVLDLFSSIWTGVVLLSLLFVYSSIGSAVPPVRQLPLFEMTEFEWFHTFVFKALIGLLCLTLVVATLRRIPLRPVNYGVWMIHSGIVILALASVVYFGTKVEGDSPVARRRIHIEAPGFGPQELAAVPGNRMRLGEGAGAWEFQVSSIDPQWELLSGEDRGARAYSVNVTVSHGGRSFVRQLIDGYPQYTEDLVRNPEPGGPPFARAVKVTGEPIVEPELALSLVAAPQPWMYLSNDIVKSWALYVREVPDDGSMPGPWVQRPVEGLPLYNDWVADLESIWIAAPGEPGRARPLSVAVEPADPADPLPGVTATIDTYLRYARLETRRRIGGDRFDPTLRLTVTRTDLGRSESYELVALDSRRSMEPGRRMVFAWAPTEARYLDLLSRAVPRLRIGVPATGARLDVEITAPAGDDDAAPFTAIEGTDYRYRVRDVYDRMPIGDETLSLAVVEIETPQRRWVRWVCDDPTRTRDLPAATDAAAGHMDPLPLDEGLVMDYLPRVAPVTIVGGPEEERLRLIVATAGAAPRGSELRVGEAVMLTDTISLLVDQYAARTSLETRPVVVPRAQRNRDARAQLSMVRARVPGVAEPLWLAYHDWPVRDVSDGLGRIDFRPTEVTLADGRRVQWLFSRQRRPLPAPVVLEDFAMETHVGGFSGQNTSVRNWTSLVRFPGPDGPGPLKPVSVNAPAEHEGFWFFQAQWDPPRPAEGYAGLNFTVLGVGNRRGVLEMLLGCCLSVLGMIYAFYVKPLIKRRRQRAVYAGLAAAGREASPPALVAAGTAPVEEPR